MNSAVVMDAISVPRLSCYRAFLGCATDSDAIGTYLAFQDLSGDFFPLLQMIEVGLRNRINTVAKLKFNTPSWYDTYLLTVKSRSLVTEAKSKALNECGAKYSDDDVICRLGLGFWVYMLDAGYRDTKSQSYLWTPENHNIAFGSAKNPWGASMSVAAIFDDFQKILKLRNRLFHHEPIWKKHGCKNKSSAVSNIEKEYRFLLKILEYVSPGEKKLVDLIGLDRRFIERCTFDKVNAIINMVVHSI